MNLGYGNDSNENSPTVEPMDTNEVSSISSISSLNSSDIHPIIIHLSVLYVPHLVINL